LPIYLPEGMILGPEPTTFVQKLGARVSRPRDQSVTVGPRRL